MIENTDKIFFIPGDVVTIKHNIANKPEMLVKGKETKTFKDAVGAYFIGIRCFWFTTEGLYQEQIFNTKDLEKIDKATAATPVNKFTGYKQDATKWSNY